jgi:hypothetical protein
VDRTLAEATPSLRLPPSGPKLFVNANSVRLDPTPDPRKIQLEQQRARNDAIHIQVKTQGEIELAKIKAALDAKMTVLETHLKAAVDMGKVQRSYPPGARKARDGHHYLPDSDRPGKYLLVVHHG